MQQCNCNYVTCSTCSYSKTFVKTLRVQKISTITRDRAEMRFDAPVVCFDSFGHNAMQVIDNGYYGTHVRPLTIHSSCIWVSAIMTGWGCLG